MFNLSDLSIIKSNINKASDRYKANYNKISQLVSNFQEEQKKSLFQGDEKTLKKVKSTNKLLARERIELILDQDAPFLELLSLAGWGVNCYTLGGSVVGGIGLVNNKLCMLIAHIGTIKGGAIDYVTLKKLQRLNDIASENNLITINLIESSGANLADQSKIFNYAGGVYREMFRRSKKGLPTISLVFGNSAAGGAYIAGASDYVIMVKDSSRLFLAGPALVKMATGEENDEESLGGSKLHNRVSGVSDYLAESEEDAIRIARELVYYFKLSEITNKPDKKVIEPRYKIEELFGIISEDLKTPYDIRELIARIVDDSVFSEFKAEYGNTLVTGFAKLHGHTIGIIANNGVLFSESANKATHFIQLCNQNNTPLVFLQNIPGFIVGKKYEEQGIIKFGANMINAVANSRVPLLTIIVGGSYGAGNFAMCGSSLQPRFIFSYPNAKMSVMGPEQISGVLELIQSQIKDEEERNKFKEKMSKDIEFQSSALFATGQMWNDGIINPIDTRNVLAFCLEIVNQKEALENNNYGVFRV